MNNKTNTTVIAKGNQEQEDTMNKKTNTNITDFVSSAELPEERIVWQSPKSAWGLELSGEKAFMLASPHALAQLGRALAHGLHGAWTVSNDPELRATWQAYLPEASISAGYKTVSSVLANTDGRVYVNAAKMAGVLKVWQTYRFAGYRAEIGENNTPIIVPHPVNRSAWMFQKDAIAAKQQTRVYHQWLLLSALILDTHVFHVPFGQKKQLVGGSHKMQAHEWLRYGFRSELWEILSGTWENNPYALTSTIE